MNVRNPEAILAKMEIDYSKQSSAFHGSELFKFHRERLIIFMRRFGGFTGMFKTPRSSWLYHDLFLAVAAISNVTQRDFNNAVPGDLDDTTTAWLKEYFEQFEILKHGSIDLNEGVGRCLAILNG